MSDFEESLRREILILKLNLKDKDIVDLVLERCEEVGLLDEENEESFSLLKSAVEDRLKCLNLSLIAGDNWIAASTELELEQEIKIKANAVTKWISEKYCDSLKPFG
jgi:hypothetical protein